jgi:hypothetical protein
MVRTIALALTATAFAATASAQPLSLGNAQMDGVTAGGLNLSVLTLAAPGVALPAPLGSPLVISQSADVSTLVNATIRPAAVSVTHPGR